MTREQQINDLKQMVDFIRQRVASAEDELKRRRSYLEYMESELAQLEEKSGET